MKKRLVVNGDDFGQSAQVNHGIIEAHNKGVLTSASVMVTGDAFDGALELSKKNRALDVGLHLCLTENRPAADKISVNRLVAKDGRMLKNYAHLFAGVLAKRIPLNEIKLEWETQILKFLSAGFSPSHIDSHQHVHLLPPLLEIFIELAKDFNFKFVRVPFELPGASSFDARSLVKWCALSPFALYANRRLGRSNLKSPDSFIGFLHSGRHSEKTMEMNIKRLKPGLTELMTHPGAIDEPEIGYFRRGELDALTSPEIKNQLQNSSIELVSFKHPN